MERTYSETFQRLKYSRQTKSPFSLSPSVSVVANDRSVTVDSAANRWCVNIPLKVRPHVRESAAAVFKNDRFQNGHFSVRDRMYILPAVIISDDRSQER